MRIEYHNAHGEQLILRMTQHEAEKMISKINQVIDKTSNTRISHYAAFETEFENDNDRWLRTEFDIVVEGDREGCIKI